MKFSNLQESEFVIRSEKVLSNSRIVFLIFSVIGLAVFWPALAGDFVGDDISRILEDESLLANGLRDVLSYYATDRPIVMFTVWLNYKIVGVSPFLYKLTNLFFHLLCVQAGFLLLKRLFQEIQFKNIAAFFAAGILLVHPLNHHVVQSAVQRSISMAGLFSILSFIYFIKFYESRAGSYWFFSVILSMLAVLCKPIAVALPAVIVIYLLMAKTRMADLVRWTSAYLILFPVPLWNYLGGASGGDSYAFKFEHWRYFLIQTKVFFIYLKKFFFPFPMEFLHSIHNSAETIYAENFIPYLLVYIVLLLALGVWFLWKRSLPAGLLLMAYVLYLPQSSFYSIVHVLFYHRVYLSIFFCAGAITFLFFSGRFFKISKGKYVVLLASAVVYFSVSTFSYFSQVKSYSDWLWYNIQANPGNLNFNVATLFMLKRKSYPPELVRKFADYIGEHNSGKEIGFAQAVATYSPESADSKKVVSDLASYLAGEQTSFNFFHGAMLFLENEAPRFFQVDQTVLSLNSLYFARLDSYFILSDATLKSAAKKNFEAVLAIRSPPSGVTEEKLEFLKLRSRVVLLTIFNESTELSLQNIISTLQSQYADMPESKWLLESISNYQRSNPKL